MKKTNKIIDNKYSLSINDNAYYDFSIFSDRNFIKLHAINQKSYFCYFLIEDKTHTCRGIASFGKFLENTFVSPINGSYGGFEFDSKISFETKEKFIKLVLEDLHHKNSEIIKIVLPPDIYNIENNCHQISILLREKFSIKNIEINQYINTKTYDKDKSVKRGNRKNINKCIKKNIFFKELNISENEDAYNIILKNRISKKYQISMQWEELKKMMKIFPNKFLNFGLFEQKKMIASAICIKISVDILYVFYWGELEEYKKISPISFLSQNIINYCTINKFKILDLGTSSQDSIPNTGLIDFKKSIGALSCSKYKLEKKLF